MFGDCKESRKLEDYAVLITKGASPKWQGFDYCDEGVLFVTSENVREGFLDLSCSLDLKFVSGFLPICAVRCQA